MSESAKKGTLWAAIGAALVAAISQNFDGVVAALTTLGGALSSQASWLVPVAMQCVIATLGPHHLKCLLPSASWIPLLSAGLGIPFYIAGRWGYLVVAGSEYSSAAFVVDALVSVTLAVAIPIGYNLLPASFRQRASYRKRMKIVDTPAGAELRELHHPSAADELTRCQVDVDLDVGEPSDLEDLDGVGTVPRVRRDDSGHGSPPFLLFVLFLVSVFLTVLAAAAALKWPWVWWVVAALVVLACILIARGVR